MAYNSRLTLMSPKEIETFNIKVIRYLKSKYKNIVIIAAEGVEKSTQTSINLCNKFYKSGADMVSLIFGEKYYFDDQIYQHFKRINDHTKIKLLLHLQKMNNGMSNIPPVVNYNLDLISKIMKLKILLQLKRTLKILIILKKY